MRLFIRLKQIFQLTTSKGCIAGTLRFKDADANYIDCSETARVSIKDFLVFQLFYFGKNIFKSNLCFLLNKYFCINIIIPSKFKP